MEDTKMWTVGYTANKDGLPYSGELVVEAEDIDGAHTAATVAMARAMDKSRDYRITYLKPAVPDVDLNRLSTKIIASYIHDHMDRTINCINTARTAMDAYGHCEWMRGMLFAAWISHSIDDKEHKELADKVMEEFTSRTF